MIKIIGELGDEDKRSIIIELPQPCLAQIQVTEDGTISTTELIKILSHCLEQQQSSDITAVERINIYDAIFNPSRAVQQRGKLL